MPSSALTTRGRPEARQLHDRGEPPAWDPNPSGSRGGRGWNRRAARAPPVRTRRPPPFEAALRALTVSKSARICADRGLDGRHARPSAPRTTPTAPSSPRRSSRTGARAPRARRRSSRRAAFPPRRPRSAIMPSNILIRSDCPASSFFAAWRSSSESALRRPLGLGMGHRVALNASKLSREVASVLVEPADVGLDVAKLLREQERDEPEPEADQRDRARRRRRATIARRRARASWARTWSSRFFRHRW